MPGERRDAARVAPVRPGAQTYRGKTHVVACQLVRHRLFRAARAIALILAAASAVFFTTFLNGVASADDPTTDPSPSGSPDVALAPQQSDIVPKPPPPVPSVQKPLYLQLSTTDGPAGTSFTATATGTQACDFDPDATVRSLSISFAWEFDQETVTAYSDGASVAFTVPEGAAPGAYQVTASCTGRYTAAGSATFTVTEAPTTETASLSLSPEQGMPGRTLVTAATTGFDACLHGGTRFAQPISWEWDSGPLQTESAGADGSTVTFVVPPDASATDQHSVTASCGSATASKAFTVIPIPTPTLTLDKTQGRRGSQLTANGTGFACDDDGVTLLLDGQTSLGEGPSGTFSEQMTIPESATISQHTVVASCRNQPDITDSKSFMVTQDTVGISPAALTLAPARGAPGDNVNVSGERFACTGSRIVEVSWDGQPLKTSSADASGRFETSISVPVDAEAGSDLVRASCAAGSAFATAGFTVVVAGTVPATIPETTSQDPPPPPPPWGGIAILLVLAVIGVIAVMAYQRWRKSRPKPVPRVYATASPTNGLPVVSTSATPAHGEVAHALRVLMHADVGTQTISEVDSDYTTQ